MGGGGGKRRKGRATVGRRAQKMRKSAGESDHRELLAVDFAIEIEGKYVGHAREIVEDGHDAGGKIGGVQLILRRDLFE